MAEREKDAGITVTATVTDVTPHGLVSDSLTLMLLSQLFTVYGIYHMIEESFQWSILLGSFMCAASALVFMWRTWRRWKTMVTWRNYLKSLEKTLEAQGRAMANHPGFEER